MRRDVVRVREFRGQRGGAILVLMMACGHWKTARKPAATTWCIACDVERQIREEDGE